MSGKPMKYRRVSVKGWEPGMGTSPVVSGLEKRVEELERQLADKDDKLARAWEARDKAQDKLVEATKHSDQTSYSSMVYWREKCYEARDKFAEAQASLANEHEAAMFWQSKAKKGGALAAAKEKLRQ